MITEGGNRGYRDNLIDGNEVKSYNVKSDVQKGCVS